MTFLDKLGLGGQTAVIGLLVVFVVLILIIAIVKLMSMFSDRVIGPVAEKKAAKKAQKAAEKEAKRKAELAAKKAQEAKPVQKKPAPAAQKPQDDLELIAVLTAAAAAMMGTSPSRVRVASYQKINRRSAWSRAGRAEQIAGRI